jgi:uncharacterized protein YpmB
MKPWQVGVLTGGAVLVMALAAGAAAVWRDLEAEWTIEAQAAQYALNHTPIQRIQTHAVFTASGVEQVFEGDDAWGKPWLVFVSGPPWSAQAVRADTLLSLRTIESETAKKGYRVEVCTPGWLSDDTRRTLHIQNAVVYELEAMDGKGQRWDVLVDAKTGQWVWKYLLST